ncbi:MAG: methyltransferase domain-containing protein [Candidatus Aminicenantaceae bacterium]
MKKLIILQKNPLGMLIVFYILVIFSLFISPQISHGLFKRNLEPSIRNSIPTVSQEKKEITIRNITKETVHYTFHEARSYGESGERSLAKGEIHRYSGDVVLDITFMHGDEEMSYRIEPGSANSFRHDENNKLDLFQGSHGRTDVVDLAPYLETPISVVEKMLEMAKLDKDDVLYDIGSGDGRIVIAAAKKYGARGVGLELDPQLIRKSTANAKAAGVDDLVSFRMEDATKANLSEATVVTMYLLIESNELMRPHLERQLKLGAHVLTHNYAIEQWENKLLDYVSLKAEDGKEHNIYLYRR